MRVLRAVKIVMPAFLLVAAPVGTASSKKKKSTAPLYTQPFEKIIRNYTFVGDFRLKKEVRPLKTEEFFWKYPFVLPREHFPYSFYDKDKPEEMERDFPMTEGSGRAVEHLNKARIYLLDWKFNRAKRTLLSARARYGKTYEWHRRTDYFLGYALLGYGLTGKGGNMDEVALTTTDNSSATFLSWAFQMKSNLTGDEELLNRVTPKAFYNLAAIYYRYGRFAGAYGMAHEGLSFLRKHGRNDFRIPMRRILAESYIENRSYTEAVMTLDQALRERGISRDQAAAIFSRVGDVYMDLNNYELAEDVYALANKINHESRKIRPVRYALRGEALFWLGRYAEAQRMFYYALQSSGLAKHKDSLPLNIAALASIRTADAWLASVDLPAITAKEKQLAGKRQNLGETERGTAAWRHLRGEVQNAEKALAAARHPLEQAKIGYFKHARLYDRHHTSDHARIRLACLELPWYKGNNTRHARTLLNDLRLGRRRRQVNPADDQVKVLNPPPKPPPLEEGEELPSWMKKEPLPMQPLPPEAVYLAWACETLSYARRDRNPAMVEKVREFAKAWPRSRFLQQFIEPVRKTQAMKLAALLQDKEFFTAVEYYEKNHKLLFSDISDKMRVRLFKAYVTIFRPVRDPDFFAAARRAARTDLDWIRLAVASSDSASAGAPPGAGFWQAKSAEIGRELVGRSWVIKHGKEVRTYLDRLLGEPNSGRNLRWIYELTSRWGENETSVACELVYPVLTRIWDSPAEAGMSRSEIKAIIGRTMAKQLNELLQFETFCGYSHLELEATAFNDEPARLAKIWLARDFVFINKVTASLYWSLSEELLKSGDRAGAERIWRYLLEKGDASIIEVRFARSRLDKRKTETESLWESTGRQRTGDTL